MTLEHVWLSVLTAVFIANFILSALQQGRLDSLEDNLCLLEEDEQEGE